MKDLERTQLYLRRSQRAGLERITADSGVTQSELVRRAIDEKYFGRTHRARQDRLRIARAAAGAWASRSETGAEYAERLRSGRLGRLHDRR